MAPPLRCSSSHRRASPFLASALLLLASLCVSVLPLQVSGQRLFFSLYQHSTTNPNRILEVYNPSCFAADLGEFSVRVATYSDHPSGAVWGATAISIGPPVGAYLARTSTWTVCQLNVAGCNFVTAALAFSGSDAVGLFHNDVLIDIIGSTSGMAGDSCLNCIGLVTPTGAPWLVAGVTGATSNYKLIRRTRVSEGTTDFFHPRGYYVGDQYSSEWDVGTPSTTGNLPPELGKFQCDTCQCPTGHRGLLAVTCGTTGTSYSLQLAAAPSGAAATQIDCPLDCLARVASPFVGAGVPAVVGGTVNYARSSPICLSAMHAGVLPFNTHAFPSTAFVPQPAPALLAPTCTWSATTTLPGNSGGNPALFPASHRPNGRPYLKLTLGNSGAAFVGVAQTCIISVNGAAGVSMSFAPLTATVCDATDCGSALGRGHCNQQTGKCACNLPWHEDSTNGVCGYADCPTASCNNGNCDHTTGKCACNAGWTGSDCTLRTCVGTCNARGVCDPLTGDCTCQWPYFGRQCELTLCFNNCTAPLQGVCDYSTGLCTCGERFFGEDCSLRRCVEHCSAFGTCDFTTGQCRCKGALPAGEPVPTACLFDDCPSNTPGVSCSGNGICDFSSRLCTCKKGWRGLDCSETTGT